MNINIHRNQARLILREHLRSSSSAKWRASYVWPSVSACFAVCLARAVPTRVCRTRTLLLKEATLQADCRPAVPLPLLCRLRDLLQILTAPQIRNLSQFNPGGSTSSSTGYAHVRLLTAQVAPKDRSRCHWRVRRVWALCDGVLCVRERALPHHAAGRAALPRACA